MNRVYRAFGKRALDLAVSVPALVLAVPWMILVGLLVRLDSPGPALFVQPRLGRAGRTFRLYKLRTMTHRARASAHEVVGRDPEVTRLGYWLRRFKLDEWPQLLNVVTGDMSLVGPRPALPDQSGLYGEQERRRLAVRPGITGLAQVHGSIYLTWRERWQWDVRYVDELALRLDLRILARTLAVVLHGEDALAPGHARTDNAAFVADVTVADGTILPARAAFEKTWRLRNTGAATWDARYALAFVGGDRLGTPESVAVPGPVRPGETVDITVTMTAPARGGDFTSEWQMRNPGGVGFAERVWAKIRVDGEPPPGLPMAHSFEVLEGAGEGRRAWLAFFAAWAGRQVFAHPDYLALYAEPGHRPACVVYRSPDGQVVWPVVLRDLRATSFWTAADPLYDVLSPPFGHGGPFVESRGDRERLLREFYARYAEWARSRRIVSEYATFSPAEPDPPPYPGEVTVKLPTVVRTLAPSVEEIWMDYKPLARRNVRTGIRNGVTITEDPAGRHVREFLSIYRDTMARRDADPRYGLDLDFLERLNRELHGLYTYFHAWHGGMIVSSELVLISSDATFFFRGGTYADKLGTRANQVLKHHVILWSKAQGRRHYLMGAGMGAGDPLLAYKASFAPGGVRGLRVGRWILDPEGYRRLLAARQAHEATRGLAWRPPPEYFPSYRAPMEVSA